MQHEAALLFEIMKQPDMRRMGGERKCRKQTLE